MQTIIILPDLHVPRHHLAATAEALRVIEHLQPDEVVLLGDYMDLDCISSHNTGKPRLTSGQTLDEDYKAGAQLLAA